MQLTHCFGTASYNHSYAECIDIDIYFKEIYKKREKLLCSIVV